jgi:ABC-type bacteriocin/lantibiotic exporter with double-glycine peptidase domain
MPMLLPVPHRRQVHCADCLSACGAMILDYLGHPLSYGRLLDLLAVTPDLGAPASNILRIAAALSIEVEYRTGTLDDLSVNIDHGIPCIVFVQTIQLSYWSEDARHAVVMVGMDDRRIYLNDPFFNPAPQAVSRLEFQLAWDEMDNTYAILALR